MFKQLRVFVASYALPKPDRSSGDRRFFEILKLLALENDVDLWTLQAEPNLSVQEAQTYRANLSKLGVRLNPWPEPLDAMLARHRYDLGLFEFYWVAETALPLFRRAQPHASVLVDSVDIHFAREALAVQVGAMDAASASKTKEREMKIYRMADAVIAVSEADRDILLKEEPALQIGLVSNIIKANKPANRIENAEVVFIGAFKWPPNFDGIAWFVHEIWPRVHAAVPEGRLTVIGSDPTEEVRALEKKPGVKVLGYVPETGPYLERAAVSVAPLRYGGGMKGKVNEAMAWGLPVVTTSIGAQGINAENGKHFLVEDTPSKFAEAVIYLLQNKDIREQMGMVAQEHTIKLCSPDAARASLQELFSRAMRNRARGNFSLGWRWHRMKFNIKSTARRIKPVCLAVRCVRKLLQSLSARTHR